MMQRFIVVTFLASAAASESAASRQQEISDEFRQKYEALRKAEEEAHLAEEEARAKSAESKADVSEKKAKVEEAKDDLNIERAIVNHNPQALNEATVDKFRAKNIEKLDEDAKNQAKTREQAAEDATTRVEQRYNETLANGDTMSASTVENLEAQATKLETQLKTQAEASPGVAMLIFAFMGAMGFAVCTTMRKQQTLDFESMVRQDPLSAGLSRSDFDRVDEVDCSQSRPAPTQSVFQQPPTEYHSMADDGDETVV